MARRVSRLDCDELESNDCAKSPTRRDSYQESNFTGSSDAWPPFRVSKEIPRPLGRESLVMYQRRKFGAQPRIKLFEDPEWMKEQVRDALLKPRFSVTQSYSTEGMWQKIARSSWFEVITLIVISVNSMWLAIDTDMNKEALKCKAAPVFQIADHFFCSFFSFELIVRLLALNRKLDMFKDPWFIFDAILVCLMIFDTWFMSILYFTMGQAYTLNSSSMLRLLRVVRLMRIARMARLLRSVPELLVLVKGMYAAIRSVALTLFLVVIALYVFALAFTQLAEETSVGDNYFASVFGSMKTLLIFGTFLDNFGDLANDLYSTSVALFFMLLLFVFLTTFTLMNMLIGVLCEVVSGVAQCERENMSVVAVTSKLESIVAAFDRDDDRLISKPEFKLLLECKEALKALSDVGIDPAGLVDFADEIFEGYDDECNIYDKQLSFSEFMNVVLQFRGTNSATMKDLINLQKFIKKQLASTSNALTEELKVVEGNILKRLDMYTNFDSRATQRHVHAWAQESNVSGSLHFPHASSKDSSLDFYDAAASRVEAQKLFIKKATTCDCEDKQRNRGLAMLSRDLHNGCSRLEKILSEFKEECAMSAARRPPSKQASNHQRAPVQIEPNLTSVTAVSDDREKAFRLSDKFLKPPSRGARRPPENEGAVTMTTLLESRGRQPRPPPSDMVFGFEQEEMMVDFC